MARERGRVADAPREVGLDKHRWGAGLLICATACGSSTAGPSPDGHGGGGAGAGGPTCEELLGPDAAGIVVMGNDGVPDTSRCRSKGCGDTRGLEPGAAWPMFGGCPTNVRRSLHRGPEEVGEIAHADFEARGLESLMLTSDRLIAVDGRGLFGFDPDSLEPALIIDGSTNAYPDAFVEGVPAVDVDGHLLFSWKQYEDGYEYFYPNSVGLRATNRDGVSLWQVEDYGEYAWFGSPTLAGDGTAYLPTFEGVKAISTTAKCFGRTLTRLGGDKWSRRWRSIMPALSTTRRKGASVPSIRSTDPRAGFGRCRGLHTPHSRRRLRSCYLTA
jgi:hypothetical protein